MCADDQLKPAAGPFDLQLGPLRYRFLAGDTWGRGHLRAMTDHLRADAGAGVPDRIVRIAREGLAEAGGSWRHEHTALGSLSYRADAPAAAWTAMASAEQPAFRYQLPWSLIIADMAPRHGAIVHAGLAVHSGRGLLFLAPSGGGKSTTLAAAPPEWTVLSDDAALVWPKNGGWQASPLPSWTMMTAPAATAASRFDPGVCCPVGGVVVLAKEPAISLTRLRPGDAASRLFRALNEYPSTVLIDPPLKEFFFRSACAMARTLPGWRLGLPLGGAIWPRLEAVLEPPA